MAATPCSNIYILCTLLQEGCCLQAFQQGLSVAAPQHVGTTLVLAHFLDHMYHHRPAKRVEASPWYEAANSLVQDLLSQTVKDARQVNPLVQDLLSQSVKDAPMVSPLVQDLLSQTVKDAPKVIPLRAP